MDDDLQFLLESDSMEVEETMKKYSNELSATVISVLLCILMHIVYYFR